MAPVIISLFFLFLLFKVKHWLADYVCQAPAFFLGKFRPGWDFVGPLAAHCGIHALLTTGLAALAGAPAATCALVAGIDFALHFAMDRFKAGPRFMGRWKPLTPEAYRSAHLVAAIGGRVGADAPGIYESEEVSPSAVAAARAKLRGNTLFWQALGFDQLVHGLTDLLTCYLVWGAR